MPGEIIMKCFRIKGGFLVILAVSLSIIAACGKDIINTLPGETDAGTRAQTPGQVITKAPGTSKQSTDGVSQPWETAPLGNDVSRRLLGTIGTLDPHQVRLSSEEDLARYLYGSLYMLQGNLETKLPEFTAYHAAGQPVSTDNKNYTITLKSGMTWSDGSAITAEDYVRSLQRLLDPELDSPAGQRFVASLPLVNAKNYQAGSMRDFNAVGCKAVGEFTLAVSLDFPRSPMDVSKAFSLPLLISQETKAEAFGTDRSKAEAERIVYAGPYVLTEYEEGVKAVLSRREDPALSAYDSEFFQPRQIVYLSFDDRTTAVREFEAGRLDAVPVSGGTYSHVVDDPRLQEIPSNTVWGLYINSRDPKASILTDPDFRKALYYGIDRTKIAVSMFGSHSSYSGFIGPLTTIRKPGTEEESADLESESWEPVVYRSTWESKDSVPKANVFDQNKADKYAELALTRFTELQTIELSVPSGGQFSDMANFLKRSIEKLFHGQIQISLRELSQSEIYDAFLSGDYDLGFGGMGQDFFDPWASLAVYTTGYEEKFNTFSSARFDELYNKGYEGQYFSLHKEYRGALKEMEDILLTELPMIPLFVDHSAWLVRADLLLPFEAPIPGVGLSLDRAGRPGQ